MSDRGIAAVLAIVMFVIYNANGREIGSYDTQPAKFAARELLLRGTLGLNHVVGRTPEYGTRSAFVLARDGRYRSAYSPAGSIAAAALFWPLWKTGVVDIRAPGAPALMATVTSSALVALAVGLSYSIVRRVVSRRRALFVAVAFGLGTGLWSTASQSLWQHGPAILGLTIAVYGLRSPAGLWPCAAAIGVGLGVAAASRLQLVPVVLVLLAATASLHGVRNAAVAGAITTAIVAPICVQNVRWFGTVLGAAPMLEALHPDIHDTSGAFALQWRGFAGLLWSPSRGLFIFSPVIALCAAGLFGMLRHPERSLVRWCLAAAAVEFIIYASYTVWWGGHTFGPRYLLDVLPLLLPLAAAASERFIGPAAYACAGVALAWSIFVAGLGAFCYPHERWNSSPLDVDRAHERLWEWSDNQIRRAWQTGPSPQNFSLFSRSSVRVPAP